MVSPTRRLRNACRPLGAGRGLAGAALPPGDIGPLSPPSPEVGAWVSPPREPVRDLNKDLRTWQGIYLRSEGVARPGLCSTGCSACCPIWGKLYVPHIIGFRASLYNHSRGKNADGGWGGKLPYRKNFQTKIPAIMRKSSPRRDRRQMQQGTNSQPQR